MTTITHPKATFGIFKSREQIDEAVSLLSRLGFGNAPAAVLFPDHEGAQDFPQVQKSEIIKFMRAGSIIGAVLFLVFGVMAAMGMVPFLPFENEPATGRVLLVLFTTLLGSMIGGAGGTLVGIGTPERAGHRYGQYVHAGGILLSVHSDTLAEQKKIEAALEESGAQDITSLDEARAWEEVFNEKMHLERVNLSQSLGQSSQPGDEASRLAEEKKIHL